MEEKKMYEKGEIKFSLKKLILVCFILGIIVVGATFALLDVSVSNGNYSYSTACFNVLYDVDGNASTESGEGDITGTLFPSSTPLGGLSGDVIIGFNCSDRDYVVGDFYLTANTDSSSKFIDTVDAHCEKRDTLETMEEYTTESSCIANSDYKWVIDGTALKYAIYNSSSQVLSVGYIDRIGESLNIYKNFELTASETYSIYIWLDGELIDNSYADLSFSGKISASVEQVAPGNNLEEPTLDSGMIPVVISDTGVVTTISSDDDDWYDYDNREWANIVLVNSDARDNYLNTSGVEIQEADILAYYVWIPRYKYKIWTTTASTTAKTPETINIVFETKDTAKSTGTAVGEYRTHPAFTFGDEEVAGIWVGKFRTTNPSSPKVVPNAAMTTSLVGSARFVNSLLFSGGTFDVSTGVVSFTGSDTYGLTSAVDSHMMKNSEYGAVMYLLHSKYGINGEIYFNNSVLGLTGRSGGNIYENIETLSVHFDDDTLSTTDAYNNFGYYTWLGQIVSSTGVIGEFSEDKSVGTNASSTGNVSGIYDLYASPYEYVMGNYNNESAQSGFSVFPDSKYYDLYTISDVGDCDIETCGGHALFETNGWYKISNSQNLFVNSSYPWFVRGYNFAFLYDFGGSSSNSSYRSVLIL